MQTSGAMDAMGIESRDEFRCGTQHDGICFPGSRRNLHGKLCCSDLSVSVAYFIWKGNKFSLCTGGNRKKICFPDLSSSSGSIRSSEKCSEGLGVSNCQIYFWMRPVLVYMLIVVTVSGISAVSAYARQNILQNNHV